MKMNNANLIQGEMEKMYPDAKCELIYHNLFELLIAVVLSAQTTDKNVNSVTPDIFKIYPTPAMLMNANLKDLEIIIKKLGLYKNKAKNLIALSKDLMEKYAGTIPSTRQELISLPGVGNKTAAVILIEGYKIPAFPVDTHVMRVSKRLNLCLDKDNPDMIEYKLSKIFEPNLWARLHHQFIFHGRYCCHAKKPKCQNCLLANICIYQYKNL